MSLRLKFDAVLLAFTCFACSLPIVGQTTPVSSATCTTPPAGVASLLIEHPVPLTAIQSTITPPNLPADIIGAVISGDKEVRSRISYNPATNNLNNDLFLVTPGAPTPTPNYDPAKRFAWINANIDKVYRSCLPRPSIMFVGLITDGYPVFGNPAGAPYAFSFGYSVETPTTVRDIVSDAAGIALVYDGTGASFSITFPNTTATVAGGPVIQTIYRQIVLDGSGSTTNTGGLTYSWSTAGTGVAILDQGTPQTRLQIGGLQGDYPVTLTVKDAFGQQFTSTVIVRFSGR